MIDRQNCVFIDHYKIMKEQLINNDIFLLRCDISLLIIYMVIDYIFFFLTSIKFSLLPPSPTPCYL